MPAATQMGTSGSSGSVISSVGLSSIVSKITCCQGPNNRGGDYDGLKESGVAPTHGREEWEGLTSFIFGPDWFSMPLEGEEETKAAAAAKLLADQNNTKKEESSSSNIIISIIGKLSCPKSQTRRRPRPLIPRRLPRAAARGNSS